MYSTLFNWEFKKGKDTADYWYIGNAGIKGALLKRDDGDQKATVYVRVEFLEEVFLKLKILEPRLCWIKKRYQKDTLL